MNEAIKKCHTSIVSHNKIVQESSGFYHTIVQSVFWGFIDDLYIKTQRFGDIYQIETLSQLRLGMGDMNKNYEHIYQFYECLQLENMDDKGVTYDEKTDNLENAEKKQYNTLDNKRKAAVNQQADSDGWRGAKPVFHN